MEENALNAAHPYAPYLDSHVLPTFGSLAGPDGSKLYYRMLAPKLEPGKRYVTIETTIKNNSSGPHPFPYLNPSELDDFLDVDLLFRQ